jgi:hypothetical protein
LYGQGIFAPEPFFELRGEAVRRHNYSTLFNPNSARRRGSSLHRYSAMYAVFNGRPTPCKPRNILLLRAAPFHLAPSPFLR